jgi:uncharacterized membrane protein YecN with MAPEG domain
MLDTSLYAALLSGMFVFLSARVICLRRASGIGLGDASDKSLLRAMRAQGNFSEYVPLALLLMLLAELNHRPLWILHVLGISLLVGRGLHAIGLSRHPDWVFGRVAGMAFTLVSLLTAALATALPIGGSHEGQ